MDRAIPRLNDFAKSELLALARTTLESYLSCGEIPVYFTDRPELRAQCGAFVTLHRGKRLRGCIGHIVGDGALYATVQRCAISAAAEDTRFPAVIYDELSELTIEISVLTPLERIMNPALVEVGTHGIMVSRGGRRGLLLPQVATENGWELFTFLGQACRKAGLSPDAWRDPTTTVETFTAQVFSESERN